jgi:putative phosphonate metabolism protein
VHLVADGPRYAIFFVPRADTEFYRLGSSVLGRDCYTGAAVDFPDIQDGAPNWNELSAAPRRYGFHATLKAPFYLLPSTTEEQLIKAVRNFAGLGHPVHAFAPAVRLLDDFFAVVPLEAAPALDSLAASCTTIFDAFRAPMSPRERARRLAMGLSHSQAQNLERWGYPFVLSEFRFHLTLTGKVPPSRRQSVLAALVEVFGRCAGEAVAVDQLALVKQDSQESSFRVISASVLTSGR